MLCKFSQLLNPMVGILDFDGMAKIHLRMKKEIFVDVIVLFCVVSLTLINLPQLLLLYDKTRDFN